jgi:hypothetical protein
MDFFRRLLGGAGGTKPQTVAGDKVGIYFYVRPKGCEEIVRVRIDRNNDLSLADDNSTYWVHKTVRGTTYKCMRSAELEAHFDSHRNLRSAEVSGGDLVTQAEYDAWLAAQVVSGS